MSLVSIFCMLVHRAPRAPVEVVGREMCPPGVIQKLVTKDPKTQRPMDGVVLQPHRPPLPASETPAPGCMLSVNTLTGSTTAATTGRTLSAARPVSLGPTRPCLPRVGVSLWGVGGGGGVFCFFCVFACDACARFLRLSVWLTASAGGSVGGCVCLPRSLGASSARLHTRGKQE